MKRRDFIKCAVAGGAALALPGLVSGQASDSANVGGKVDLAVAQGPSPDQIVRAAIGALGGIGAFITKGDVVVVKPNIGWDRTPEQAANTNPEVVATIVQMCFEAGAKKVKIFDRPCNDARRTYVQSGIQAAAEKVGAEVSFIDEKKFKDVSIKGQVLKNWPLYTELFEADKIINVPILKHHRLGLLTMSLKNWMGMMGGQRGQIHQRLAESLADLALVIKPTLTVLDAVRVLTDNGPVGGDLKDVKKLDTVVAGVDQVAIDTYGATLFGMKPADLPTVTVAAAAGIGQMDLNKLNIKTLKVAAP